MTINHNYCIIMAGGVGTRFWPMSRTSRPKQFIDILGTGSSLIQQTFRRFSGICPPENVYVVTHEMYRDLVMEQLPGLTSEQILLEPFRRNTAPCIAYAASKIYSKDPDANLVVAPSDHLILQEEVFKAKIHTALKSVLENDWLVTLGIKPSRPDTGYGYIQFERNADDSRYEGLHRVKTFTEKPSHELAVTFIESGEFLWNSGIFIWSAKSILKAFDDHLPEVGDLFKKGAGVYYTSGEAEFIRDTYTVCKSISVDYGIMEKAGNVFVIESDFGWSDLGTWGSLYDIRQKDGVGNTISGKNVLTYSTSDCIISIPGNKLAVLQGLTSYIVVEDDDILLVCRKEDEQQLRQIVDDVKKQKGEEYI